MAEKKHQELDVRERRRQKEASRRADERALREGVKDPEQLRRENALAAHAKSIRIVFEGPDE